RVLETRAVSLAGTPTGAETVAFHGTVPANPVLYPVEHLAAAADPSHVIFFASEATSFSDKLWRVEAGAAPPTSPFDSGADIVNVAATASAGGIASLWRWRVGTASTANSEVRVQREGGRAPFTTRDSGLPAPNASQHTIAPLE